MTTSQPCYLRNPMTGDVVKANHALARKLLGYCWQHTTVEEYRQCFVKQQTSQLMRTEVN